MSPVECPTCAATVPDGTTFCPECGSPAPPPEGIETRLRTYWAAPDLGLIVGLLLAGVGIVLLGAQVWLWAFLALVLAAAVFALRWEVGRRGAGAAFARISTHRRVVGARSRGQIELFRLRRELAELQAERSQAFQELGRVTHAGDEPGAAVATERVDDVSARIDAKEGEIAVLLDDMRERVRRAQADVTPTVHLESPPEPPRIPEPYPPPDEGDPPEPARVPEPFPEPVPEPSPGDPAPEPEHPPAPETKRRKASGATNS